MEMKKKTVKKLLIAGCLSCFALATFGATVAVAETKEWSNDKNKDFGYAPTITVEWGEYSAESVPQAVKGVAYQLFDVHAKDIYGAQVAVDTNVYLHYLEDTKALIDIENNCVTPKHYGKYTVEYKATDAFGNVSVVTYDFLCEERETLTMFLSGGDETGLAGQEIAIADCVYDNAIGRLDVEITATHENGKVVYDLSDNATFVPMYAGEYVIEYVVSDYNLTKTERYTVSVSEHDTPLIFGEMHLPKYFIVGKEYVLPQATAYHFALGKPVSLTPQISVQQVGERETLLDGTRKFVATQAGELTVTYAVRYGDNVQTKAYKAQAVDVGKDGKTFDITKYFYAPNALLTANANAVTVVTETNDTKIDFINALSAREVLFDFGMSATYSNFNALDICLTDSEDPSVQVVLTYENVNDEIGLVSVNGGLKYETRGFSYVNTQYCVYDETANTMTFNGATTLDLGDFKGFPSGKVYFSLAMRGVVGRSQMNIYSINNHVFAKSTGDGFAPKVWFSEYEKGTCQINELVTIDPVEICDVLDPNCIVNYSVVTPESKYVVSEDGINLNGDIDYTSSYTFRVDEYGDYRVRIKVQDSSGNEASYVYTITVKDVVAPVVLLDDKMPTQLKVGETFTVSEITAYDDVSEELDIYVVLFGPKGTPKEMTMGNTYKFNDAGEYALYYMVADEEGNMTMISHMIRVA